MNKKSIKLSESLVNILVKLPENGMGYQIVKVVLKNGDILHHHKVLNSSILMLEDDESVTENDIKEITLEN